MKNTKDRLPDRSESRSAAINTILASIVSIVIGLAVGSIIVLIVGLTSDTLSASSAWDGIRIVFLGIFSTGRDAAGHLTFGFNPTNVGNMLFRATPLIMTGLSVAVAFKTGLFNIGAPGQYLMGTMASLMIALGIPERRGSAYAHLDTRLPGRRRGRRALGLHPRPRQGVSEHQRGPGLHHDELDRSQRRDLGL